MKVFLALIVLLPLAYSMPYDPYNLTEEQKRVLFKTKILSDIKNKICKALPSDVDRSTCAAQRACSFAFDTTPYSSLASTLCGLACNVIAC